jgi:hypothetical protein
MRVVVVAVVILDILAEIILQTLLVLVEHLVVAALVVVGRTLVYLAQLAHQVGVVAVAVVLLSVHKQMQQEDPV